MRYPKFLKKDSKIVVFAPSQGAGYKLEKIEKSINCLKNQGYIIDVYDSVYSIKNPSCSAIKRSKEFNSIINDLSVDAIFPICGGDFLFEILEHIKVDNNFDKLIIGASDPTSLLYYLTTTFDIATFYGFNGGSFDEINKPEKLFLELLKGNLKIQNSYKKYFLPYSDELKFLDVKWTSNYKEFYTNGRLIGGCLDCLDEIFMTKYDNTLNFIDKYKDDGIVWYFDIYSLSSENTYRMLWKMKQCGYFKHVKAVLVGRVLFSKSDGIISYKKAFEKIFKKIPVIMEMDIGHTYPTMYLINGSIINIKYNQNKGSISFKLKK